MVIVWILKIVGNGQCEGNSKRMQRTSPKSREKFDRQPSGEPKLRAARLTPPLILARSAPLRATCCNGSLGSLAVSATSPVRLVFNNFTSVLMDSLRISLSIILLSILLSGPRLSKSSFIKTQRLFSYKT